MSHSIVLSGPADVITQARRALKGAGFTEVPTPENHWGLHDSHETEWSGARYTKADIKHLDEHSPGHGHAAGDIVHGTGEIVPKACPFNAAFITVEADTDDVGKVLEAAHDAVEPLGWRLRSAFNNDTDIDVTPEYEQITLDQRLARIESDLAIVKGIK